VTLLDSRRDPAVGVRDQPIRRYARFVVFLRFPIALAWMAAVVAAVTSLPALSAEQHHGLHALVPADSPALAAELESIRDFGYPLLARTVVVQRDPNGLSTEAQARAVMRAVALTRGEMSELRGIAAAVPATNALGLLPSAREQGTTALTYRSSAPTSRSRPGAPGGAVCA
jgi:RND superfamily putative drug exporter